MNTRPDGEQFEYRCLYLGCGELFCSSVGCCCWASVKRSCSCLCKGLRSKDFEIRWMAPGYWTSGGVWFVSVRISTTRLGQRSDTVKPFIHLPTFLWTPTLQPQKCKEKINKINHFEWVSLDSNPVAPVGGFTPLRCFLWHVLTLLR